MVWVDLLWWEYGFFIIFIIYKPLLEALASYRGWPFRLGTFCHLQSSRGSSLYSPGSSHCSQFLPHPWEDSQFQSVLPGLSPFIHLSLAYPPCSHNHLPQGACVINSIFPSQGDPCIPLDPSLLFSLSEVHVPILFDSRFLHTLLPSVIAQLFYKFIFGGLNLSPCYLSVLLKM